MSKWLIEYYPIAPAHYFEVYNLDVLEYKDYCSKNYQEEVKAKLDYFNLAVTRHGIIGNNITYYNNSTLGIVEADTVKDALMIFFGEESEELKMEFSYKPINPFQNDTLSKEDKVMIDAMRNTAYVCGYRGGDVECAVHKALKRLGRIDLLPPCEREERK